MGTARKARKAATAAASKNNRAPDRITLSNGIVLALKPIPPGYIERALEALEKPQPPVTKPFEGKDIEEANPADPEYTAALEAHSKLVIETGTNVLLLVGTGILSIPEGVYSPEGDEWYDPEITGYFGIEVDTTTKYDRYLSWLTMYALASQEDVVDVMAALTRRAGIGEEDAAAAVARFRRRKARRADRDVPS
jgi:hypothetical protein